MAKDEIRGKLDSLRDQKPTEKQRQLIEQYMFSEMLNTSLERVHEEVYGLNFKLEIMEN